MDSCVDHPENTGVFQCQTCFRLICDQHSDLLCFEDSNKKNKVWPILILIIGVLLIISIFSYFIYVELSTFLNQFQDVTNGDVVTVNGETIIGTNFGNFPDFSTIVFFAIVIFVPVLIAVAFFVRKQIVKFQTSPEGLEETEKSYREITYYCQSCGTKNTMKDSICIKCGKSTEQERKFIN